MNASRHALLLAIALASATASHAVPLSSTILYPTPGGVHVATGSITIPAGAGGDFETIVESLSYRTDPNDADSDDDGLTDGDEDGIVLDSADTDGDGLPDAAGQTLVHQAQSIFRAELTVHCDACGPDGGPFAQRIAIEEEGVKQCFISLPEDQCTDCGPISFDIDIEGPEMAGVLPTEFGAGTVSLRARRKEASDRKKGRLVVDPSGDITQVDSFFVIVPEVSYDGGQNWTAATGSLRLDLIGTVPEPSAALLVGIATVVVGSLRRAS